MTSSLKKSILLFAALICSSISLLFASPVSFKHVDATSGLSSNRINAIIKDSKGFMWFGTSSGLNRWDGYDMRLFVSDSRNAKSLPDNEVESVQEARDGTLWVKTGAGYAVFDPRTEDFNTDMNGILTKMGISAELPSEIKLDVNRNLWIHIKGEGVYYYKPSMKLLYEFTYTDQRQGLPEGEIASLAESKEGMLCCYTDGRVVCLDGEHQRIVWEEDYVASHGGNPNDQYNAFSDRKDNIWLWNSTSLYIYKKNSNTWLNSLEELAREWNTTVPAMEDGRFRCMTQDKSGKLWIATENSGVLLVDPNEKKFELVTNDDSDSRSLRSNNILSLYIDNNDVVWVGSAKHGASFYSDDMFKFGVEWLGDITTMIQDGAGNLWLGTSDKGLICKNLATGLIRTYNRQNSGLPSDQVSCLAISGKRIWVGSTRSGICYIEDGKVNVLGDGRDGSSLASSAIQALEVDAHGNLWIATQAAGLQLWNFSTGNFTTYSLESGHLLGNNVSDLQKQGNKLLIGTNAGLAVMQIETKKFKTYVGNEKGDVSFRSTSVISVYGDSRGYYWVGSREGLAVYDPSTDNLALIGAQQGLRYESVLAITEDNQKNIWVTTTGGASKILVQDVPQGKFPSSFHVFNYDQQDGLQSGSFNQNSILALDNGVVLFGGMSGLNNVDVNLQKATTYDEHLYFTRLFLNGTEVEIRKTYEGQEILPAAFSTLDRITLPNGASIDIRIASDSFGKSDKLQYVYRLDGVDNTWITGGEKGISYEKLSSGTYTLHVKTIYSKGEEKVLVITVGNTIWMSNTAYVIYFSIFILFIFLMFWVRPRVKAKQAIIKATEAQMAQIKVLAEELRIPVSTMIPPLNSLVEFESDPKKREFLTTVHYQATQILSLVNEMQELNKSEKIDETISDMAAQRPKVVEVQDEVMLNNEQNSVMSVHYQVLLVDDNEEFLTFLKDSLPEQFEVTTASSGEEAWNKVCNELPQLVVCESDMEGVTGSDLCVRMKSDRDFDKIPFIMMTDSGSALEIGDGGISNRVTATADEYIAKPFNIQVLVSFMNRLLGIRSNEVEEKVVESDDSAIESRAIAATLDEQLRLNAEQFVLQNVSRTNLSVEEMAKSLNMSRAHLYKKLNAITGKTPVEFVRSVRMKQAAMLLQQGTFTVEEVAAETGFNHVDSFVKYFKAEFGCPPEEFRALTNNRFI